MIPQPFTTAARTRTLLFLLRFNKKSTLKELRVGMALRLFKCKSVDEKPLWEVSFVCLFSDLKDQIKKCSVGACGG